MAGEHPNLCLGWIKISPSSRFFEVEVVSWSLELRVWELPEVPGLFGPFGPFGLLDFPCQKRAHARPRGGGGCVESIATGDPSAHPGGRRVASSDFSIRVRFLLFLFRLYTTKCLNQTVVWTDCMSCNVVFSRST